MKLDRNILEKSLKMLKYASRRSLPSENIVFVSKNDEKSINLELQSRNSSGLVTIPAQDIGNIDSFVDINLFLKIIKSIKAKNINISREENHIALKSNKTSFKIATTEGNIDKIDVNFDSKMVVSVENLLRSIGPIVNYCKPKSVDEMYRGIFFNKNRAFVATRQRMAASNTNAFSRDFFIESNFIDFISQLDNNLIVTIKFGGAFIKVISTNLEFIFNTDSSISVPPVDTFLQANPTNCSDLPIDKLSEVSKFIGIINPDKVTITCYQGNIMFKCDDGVSHYSENVDSNFKSDFEINIESWIFRDAISMAEKSSNGKGVNMKVLDDYQNSPILLNSGDITQVLSIIRE